MEDDEKPPEDNLNAIIIPNLNHQGDADPIRRESSHERWWEWKLFRGHPGSLKTRVAIWRKRF